MTVFKMLPLLGGADDDDSITFTKVFKISQRMSMFLIGSSEGLLIYQFGEDDLRSSVANSNSMGT